MSIFIIGINHKTAPVSIREKVYFAFDKLALYLQDLINRDLAKEAVLLSTCNRSELYCDGQDVNAITNWFCKQTTLPREVIEPSLYTYQEEEALTHMMEVACGIDSMVLGETQILGQMKEAFSESCTAGAVSATFHRLFQQIFAVAKEIRTSTAIGACPVSVASAAVHFAKQEFLNFTHAKVVLIGVGEASLLIMQYLKTHCISPTALVNRSKERAFAGKVYGFDKIHEALIQADIVFSATSSPLPIINKEIMMDVMNCRPEKPIILMDVAVPRDVDPAVLELPNVKLFCIDDLKMIIEKNRQGREHAAIKAQEMIYKKSAELMIQLKCIDNVTYTIRAYRGQIEEICHTELIKAKQQLHQGVIPTQVLDDFAKTFTKKLLHGPSVYLRQAGAEGRSELLSFAKQLFAIPDSEVEKL